MIIQKISHKSTKQAQMKIGMVQNNGNVHGSKRSSRIILYKHIFTLIKEGGVRIIITTSKQGTLFGATDQHEVHWRSCSLNSLYFGNHLLLLFRFQNFLNFSCNKKNSPRWKKRPQGSLKIESTWRLLLVLWLFGKRLVSILIVLHSLELFLPLLLWSLKKEKLKITAICSSSSSMASSSMVSSSAASLSAVCSSSTMASVLESSSATTCSTSSEGTVAHTCFALEHCKLEYNSTGPRKIYLWLELFCFRLPGPLQKRRTSTCGSRGRRNGRGAGRGRLWMYLVGSNEQDVRSRLFVSGLAWIFSSPDPDGSDAGRRNLLRAGCQDSHVSGRVHHWPQSGRWRRPSRWDHSGWLGLSENMRRLFILIREWF